MYDPIATIREANERQKESAGGTYSIEGELSKAVALSQMHYKNEQFIDGSPYIERAYRMFNYTYASTSLAVRVGAILQPTYVVSDNRANARRAILACFPEEIDKLLTTLEALHYISPTAITSALLNQTWLQNNPAASLIKQYEYIDILATLERMNAYAVYDSIRDNKRCKWFSSTYSPIWRGTYYAMTPQELYDSLAESYNVAVQELVYHNLTRQATVTK